MTDYILPCDTFVRLTNVLHDFHENATEWFRTIRIDNGQAVASNRIMMVVENVGGPAGIIHVKADAALIAQCRTEAQFSSVLTITVNKLLQFAVAKTTLGYVHPGNCCLWSGPVNDLDHWRLIAARAAQPIKKSVGCLFWDADQIARVAASSPSGRIVFEEHIDATGARPTILRDVNDPDWLAIYNPCSKQESYSPAIMPTWMKV